MKLIDTNVWIDFFGGRGGQELADLLEQGDVLLHPWVLGELALGNLGRRRAQILRDLRELPSSPVASDIQVLEFIESHRLFGGGIGWVDAHLLVAARLNRVELWT